NMKYIKIIMLVCVFASLGSCKKYLDIVPDNVATIEYAFRMRSTAERYLFTCYSYLPNLGDRYSNVGLYGADEFWLSNDKTTWRTWNIAKGEQNINSPLFDNWNGLTNGTDFWEAISQCNVFLENIESVPDLEDYEKLKWISEVKFLKAYYHFQLLKSYGPIPIIDENLPISASGEEVRVFRRPVDEVFDYIVQLI